MLLLVQAEQAAQVQQTQSQEHLSHMLAVAEVGAEQLAQ
jgi:hypothetical protein